MYIYFQLIGVRVTNPSSLVHLPVDECDSVEEN